MQPKMKKKKSVGKLEVKDTNKASKYVLTTQNSDSKGNVETQMVKVCTVELRGNDDAIPASIIIHIW